MKRKYNRTKKDNEVKKEILTKLELYLKKVDELRSNER